MDPALAARLLRVGAGDLLKGTGPELLTPKDGGLLGALFEALVTLSVRVYAQAAEATLGHFRAFGGEREVDLIVKGESGRVIAIEAKLAATPSERDDDTSSGSNARSATSCSTSSIVTTGEHGVPPPGRNRCRAGGAARALTRFECSLIDVM